jgi:hypothetical protein
MMATKQRAFIVSVSQPGYDGQKEPGIAELNKALAEGWVVKSVHQMTAVLGGGNATWASATCLVIAEQTNSS